MFLIDKLEDLVELALERLDRMNTKPLRRVLCACLFVFVALASFLYCVGLWDFTFIERPKPKREPAVIDAGDTPTTETPPEGEPPADTSAPETPSTPATPATPATPSDDAAKVFRMSDLCAEGYYVTSRDYDPSSHKIAVLNVDLGAPKELSVRERNVERPVFDQDIVYGEQKVVGTELVAEARPSLEAYGGYLFADNGTDVIIFDCYGRYVTNYNEDLFFANTRDRFGNVLFYFPTTMRVYDRDAEHYADVPTKSYYALTAGGIVGSDYSEEVYSRGVNADLPASYGAQTEPYERSVIVNTASHMSLKGELTGWTRTLWGFTAPGGDEPFTFGWYDPDKKDEDQNAETEDVADTTEPDEDKKPDSDKDKDKDDKKDEKPKLSAKERFELAVQREKDWDETPSHAYNFSEGYACVANEKGQMWFIDRTGKAAFESKDIHGYNAVGRPVVDNLLLPLTNGIESLGFYYFDYGLVRVRRQSYDYLQVEDWDTLRPEFDDDELIYANGERFTLAEGYDIISYSNGMILLEKNGKYGYMDYTGAWIVQPDLENAKPFVEGIAPIERGGKWGAIDTAGNTVIPFEFDSVQTTSSGVIVCHGERGWSVFAKMAVDE